MTDLREQRWTGEPSLVRQALDELLRRYPHFDLLSVEWQESGSWVLVVLGDRGTRLPDGGASFKSDAWARWYFTIWRYTGALHTMEPPGGPVSDDPIWTPWVALPCDRHPEREAVAKIGLPGPGSRWACQECFAEHETRP